MLSKVNRYVGNLFFDGYYDIPIVRRILTFSARYPTFLDVGAHTGAITLAVANAFRRCVAVEPSPFGVEILRRKIESNTLANCEVIQCALGAKSGFGSLYMSSDQSGDKSLAPRSDIPRHTIVRVLTLDSLSKEENIKPPCVLKLDVQGYEPFVCMSGHRLLDDECVIVSEFWPWGMKSVGSSPQEFIATMTEMGFVMQSLGGKALAPDLVARLIRYGEHDRYVTTDVLFIRPSSHTNLRK